MRQAALAMCWLFATAGLASAAVIYEEKVDTFDIGVRNGDARAVWDGIRRWGPSANGGHALGTTTGRVRWGYKRVQSSRGCSIQDVKVTVQADIKVPGWPYSARADAPTKAYWTCISKVVSVHEQRHAEIWRETAKSIDDALRGLSDVMRCEAVEGLVNTTANRIYEEGRTRQTEFDAAEAQSTSQQDCAQLTKTAAIEAEAKSDTAAPGKSHSETSQSETPGAVEQAVAEPAPYPMPAAMPAKAERVNAEQKIAAALDQFPSSVPLGALLGGGGVLALFGITYLIVSVGQAATRRSQVAAAQAIDAAVQVYDETSADRRITPDRRAKIRAETEIGGRRASDFGRRPS